MADFLIHVAGPSLRAGDVIRQRCVWCGALIEERDLANVAMPVPEGLSEQEAAEYVMRQFVDKEGKPTGGWDGLVAVETHGERAVLGTTAKWAIPDPPDGKMPEDSCMALPDEATR